MTVLLIAVVTYTAFLIPRQIWDRRAVRKFFRTVTRVNPAAGQAEHEQSIRQETPVPEAVTVS